jgi:hypothetical protein
MQAAAAATVSSLSTAKSGDADAADASQPLTQPPATTQPTQPQPQPPTSEHDAAACLVTMNTSESSTRCSSLSPVESSLVIEHVRVRKQGESYDQYNLTGTTNVLRLRSVHLCQR